MLDSLSALASLATAIGVGIAAWQLWLSKRQAATAFEDSLAKEYREIAATLPVKALLGEPLDEGEYTEKFDEFYRYFDLCNQQIFLHRAGRVSARTWLFWRDGMASNLARPAFARAWTEVARRSNGDFSELRSEFPPKPGVANSTDSPS